MKRYIYIIGFIFSIIISEYQSLEAQTPKPVNSKISQVMIYTSGAQVTRDLELNLEKGENYIVVSRLTQNLDDASVTLKGLTGVQVLSIAVQSKYYSLNEDKPVRVIQLQDSIDYFQFLLDQLEAQKSVLEENYKLLSNNKTPSLNGLDAATLEELQNLFHKRIFTIKNEILKNDMQHYKFKTQKKLLKKQLDEITRGYNSYKKEVQIKLYAEAKKTLKVNLNYFVQGVSWYPTYDIRVKDNHSNIQLTYKANISQSTGEDWNQVLIKISNANPNLGLTRPVLNPVYASIGYTNEGFIDSRGRKDNVMSNSITTSKWGVDDSKSSVIKSNGLNIEFNVMLPQTILSNGKVAIVDAQIFEMPAIYNVRSVPKMDAAAYLIGTINGNEELGQLNGKAYIYYEGTFVGESKLSNNESDSIDISLGKDKSIAIERKKIRENSSKSFLGSTKKETNTFEITVRNTKKESCEILIEDQIPLSNDNQIVVTADEVSGGTINELTGKVTWKVNLQPGELKKLTLTYTIKYPKNKVIQYNNY